MTSEPVWPSGSKALKDLGSMPLLLSFSSERLWFVGTVLWLCPSLPTETLKWLSSLPIFMQKSFWWWQCSDRYIISLSPHLHTPFSPFSPSLISHTVSVEVKHHVYLLLDDRNSWTVLNSYVGSLTNIITMSLNEIHIDRLQPKSTTKGKFLIYFCLLLSVWVGACCQPFDVWPWYNFVVVLVYCGI